MEAVLVTTIITAAAVSYVTAGLDNFLNVGSWRGLITLALAIPGNYVLGLRDYELGMASLAAAFISLAITFALDRPRVVPGRRF